jgi:hypothetical protein
MHLLKMEPTQCCETSAFNTQTPGKYPEDNLSRIKLVEASVRRCGREVTDKISGGSGMYVIGDKQKS